MPLNYKQKFERVVFANQQIRLQLNGFREISRHSRIVVWQFSIINLIRRSARSVDVVKDTFDRDNQISAQAREICYHIMNKILNPDYSDSSFYTNIHY